MQTKTLIVFLIALLIVVDGCYVFYNIAVDTVETEDNPLQFVNLGSNGNGSVEIIGPIGNNSSNITIAYIIGVHPLEHEVHTRLYNSLINQSDSLKYSYYIYRINVTNNPDDYEIGRMSGQLLANEFVVPDITSKDYNFVADIHSHQGVYEGTYEENYFIFTPLNDDESVDYSQKIINQTPNLVYYYPYSQTSPAFVTIPIIQSGTPAIVYETYEFEEDNVSNKYMKNFIKAIEKLKFKN